MRSAGWSSRWAPAWLAVVVATGSAADGASVGQKAPPLRPRMWMNNRAPVTARTLQGRLVLIEKWATW